VRLRATVFGRTYRQTLRLTADDLRRGAVIGSGKFSGQQVGDFTKMMIGMTLPKVIRGIVSSNAQLFGLKLKPRIKGGWLQFETKLTPRSYKLLNTNIRKAFLASIQHTVAKFTGYNIIGKKKIGLPNPLPKKADSLQGAIQAKFSVVKAELAKLVRGHSSAFVKNYKAPSTGINVGLDLIKEMDTGIDGLRSVLTAMKTGATALGKAAQALSHRRPSVHSIKINPIYVKCMLHPKHCNSKLIREPHITVCFTYIGCASTRSSGYVPPIAQLPRWIQSQAKRKIDQWLDTVLVSKKIAFNKPAVFRIQRGVPNSESSQQMADTTKKVHTANHLNKEKAGQYETHVQMQHVEYSVPIGIRARVLKAFKSLQPQRGMSVAKKADEQGFTAWTRGEENLR